jgi:hypothetical protein
MIRNTIVSLKEAQEAVHTHPANNQKPSGINPPEG